MKIDSITGNRFLLYLQSVSGIKGTGTHSQQWFAGYSFDQVVIVHLLRQTAPNGAQGKLL